MSNDDPVSVWLDELKQGEEGAAFKIWNHFVLRLHDVARLKLHGKTQRVYDEQDATQSAFNSLFGGINAGRFPDLSDRTGLWRLLLVITARKISNRHKHDNREMRDVRRTVTDSVFSLSEADVGFADQFATREPAPEFAAEFVEFSANFFDSLEPDLQRIGWMKMQGYEDQEIAEQLNCTRRTIRRKVERIRRNLLDE